MWMYTPPAAEVVDGADAMRASERDLAARNLALEGLEGRGGALNGTTGGNRRAGGPYTLVLVTILI
jgi:hypothetical protein